MKRAVIFIIVSLTCIRQNAQSKQYLFSHLDVSAGLSNNHINTIYKDARGFMWFGTSAGLNRYDGYQFKIFLHDIRDSTTISDNYIDKIFEDFNGKLWLETRAGFNIFDPDKLKIDRNTAAYLKKYSLPEYGLSNMIKTNGGCWFLYPATGLYRYMPNGKVIAIKHDDNDKDSPDASDIADAKADGQGNIWLVHVNGLLEKITEADNKIVYRTWLLQNKTGNSFANSFMYIDAQNDIWFYSGGIYQGIYYYNLASGRVKKFTQESAELKLSNNLVLSIVQDSDGLIWIGTDHGGINIVDKNNFSVTNITSKDDDENSLAENSINAIFKDNLGIVWLGTFKKGIDYYQTNAVRFPRYSHQLSNRASLNYDDINSFVEDAGGNIWIGTNGGGLLYFNRKENTFRQLLHNTANSNSLSNNVIVGMCLDHNNKLWIGTYYGGLDCYDGKKFTHYRHNDAITGSLADDRVMEIYEDSYKDLWIGTLGGGLDRFNKNDNSFTHFKSGGQEAIYNNYISSVKEDTQKNLWVGTAYGISVMNRTTGLFSHYLSADSKLSNENIVCLLMDSRGNTWVGTREGLNLLNPDKKTFQTFRMEDGLVDNSIRNIQEDNQHNIWVSTANGISKVTLLPDNKTGYKINCKNYDELDGLQGREFNNNTGLKLKTGEILFGGPGGFNIFNPSEIKANQHRASIVFTDFQVFNKSVNVGEEKNKHIILPVAISEIKEIKLLHDENVFSIEFASLGFINTKKNKYAYMLENFNKGWLVTDGKQRMATFTNLDAGEYTFRVKASNEDGIWNDEGIALKIIVLPPFWKTPFAYFVYILVIAAILYMARRIVIQRARMRFALEQERREAQRMHELDLMKIRFFTNMSHELRTPISLILAPVDKLLRQPRPEDKKHYALIKRNARRLLNLVNQLLDFRKLEADELKLHITEGDFVKLVKDTSLSFSDLAESKNISFSFQSALTAFYTRYDQDKIERILFNLLSNAFKFTPENGSISVELYRTDDEEKNSIIGIRVKDTGIGIAPDKQEKIFERFFQSDIPNTVINQGSGIGLAITKEFVKMHEGSIMVESQLNAGTCFTVSLPLPETERPENMLLAAGNFADDDANDSLSVMDEPDTMQDSMPSNLLVDKDGIKKPLILVVEDNEDFRFYLKDNLRAYFTIIEATNGKEGWQKTLSRHPDLVVSDISMPIMDGIELCKKIKTDGRTNQLPVILLTAFAGEDKQLRGLGIGATDYMTKPFNFEILLSKVRNLLNYQATVKKTYQKQVQAHPMDIEVYSADDDFIKKVLLSIENNIDNPDFSVEEMSQQLFISRGSMYKKLFVLTGKSPVEFIRHIRLQRAALLLEKSQFTVAEIAYKVGFNSPKYFARYFKTEFGMIPSAYRSETGKNKDADIGQEREAE